ncbi:FH1/FH2 domain-containing protein 1 isoform X2 [Synchiropus splendidus]|uniref:FH1/FH2 domain-containing protein 1 isoform X2 n=1 Tax=Synchiropus splendidus TaxID=270530 RepID=UPI00237D876B|nr:FH1/FH2 domain-containing protein 1 isoform X2 [Synchiropus splendidus]
MKEQDQFKEKLLSLEIDQTRALLIKPTACLCFNTLDFTDLWDEEDLAEDQTGDEANIPITKTFGHATVPPPPPLPPPAPPLVPYSLQGTNNKSCTLKLHWKDLPTLSPLPRKTRFGTQTIWAGLQPVNLDTNYLVSLFESKGKNNCLNILCGKKKHKALTVLGMKRSNIITIALSSLPPAHLLPIAIHSMDGNVLDREDIQRLQEIIPSEEELTQIKEAKAKNPSLLLAPAELCLLTLGEISHLSSRLQLWAFTLDYDSLEREIAEPLFYLKLAIEQLSSSQTFRYILSTVLAIGNFLNGCNARGFELSYLGSLSQCDYSLVQSNLSHLDASCKASWDKLKILDKEDDKSKRRKGEKKRGSGREGDASTPEGVIRHRLPKILKDCEERLKVLRAVYRRVINRYHSFLLFLGYSPALVRVTKAEDFCRTISNFSLEFRTMREAIVLQRERKGLSSGPGRAGFNSPAAQRRHQQPQEDDEHCRLVELLNTPEPHSQLDSTCPRSRRKTKVTQGSLFRK